MTRFIRGQRPPKWYDGWWIVALVLLWFLVIGAAYATVAYVVLHFVEKFW